MSALRLTISTFDQGAADDLLAEIQSALDAIPSDASSLAERVESLLASGGGVELELNPTGRAGELCARLHPSDALLELLPALRTGDRHAL